MNHSKEALKKNLQAVLVGFLLTALPLIWVYYCANQSPIEFDAEAAKRVAKTKLQLAFGEHNNWYLWVNLATLFFPLLLSFDKKVAFYKKWKFLLPAILIVGAFFLFWDIYFTKIGVWGFNERYYSQTYAGLPLGEWLFFFTVPYACVFTHECIKVYFPRDYFFRADKLIGISLILIFLAIALLNLDKLYTAWTFLLAAAFLIWHYLYKKNTYRTRFYLAYLICLLPFIMVNGILTGAFNREPIVLYHNQHNLTSLVGVRFITIPFDDFVYGFLLLFLVSSIYETLIQSSPKYLSKSDSPT